MVVELREVELNQKFRFVFDGSDSNWVYQLMKYTFDDLSGLNGKCFVLLDLRNNEIRIMRKNTLWMNNLVENELVYLCD